MNNFTAINDDDNITTTTNSHTIECVCATVFTVVRFHLQYFFFNFLYAFFLDVFFSFLVGMCDCIIYHTLICEPVRSECKCAIWNVPRILKIARYMFSFRSHSWTWNLFDGSKSHIEKTTAPNKRHTSTTNEQTNKLKLKKKPATKIQIVYSKLNMGCIPNDTRAKLCVKWHIDTAVTKA